MRTTALGWFLMLSLGAGSLNAVGCGDDDDDDTSGDGDADSDADSDSDADADADGDGDGDGDADADGDGDGDADGDGDCDTAAAVPILTCGAPAAGTVDFLCEQDVAACQHASDCAMVNIDDCCGLEAIAVLASREADVTSRVPECPNPGGGCDACVLADAFVDCVEGRCALVDANSCISEDEAIDIAVRSHYEHIADPGAGEIIEPVERGDDGSYVVHVCDLNIECACRANEGWLVTVSCDGTITDDALLGMCPFG